MNIIGVMKIRRICQMCWIAKFESDGSPEDKFCPKCRETLGMESTPSDITGRPTPKGPKKTASEIVRSKPLDIDWSQLKEGS